MIGKDMRRAKDKTSSFIACVKYVTSNTEDSKDKVLYFGSVNLSTKTPKKWAIEMEATASQSRSKKSVMHLLLSWQEGENPTRDQIEEAVQITLKELGYEDHECVWAVHQNTDNIHLHLCVNRVNIEDGKVVFANKGFTQKAMEKVARRVELVQGWEIDDNPWTVAMPDGTYVELPRKEEERKVPQKLKDFENRTGEKSAIRIGQEQVKERILAANNWQEIHEALAEIGCRYEKKGSGAVVWIGDIPVKASSISKNCGLNRLQRKFDLEQGRVGDFEPAPEGLNVKDVDSEQEPERSIKQDPKQDAEQKLKQVKESILAAQNWQEVHKSLAEIGCRYERKGSGAIVWIGDKAVNASKIGHNCTIIKLQKKFDKLQDRTAGDFEPAPDNLKIGKKHISHPVQEFEEGSKEKKDDWKEYIAQRDTYLKERKAANTTLKEKHSKQFKEMIKLQKEDRADLAKQGWKGRSEDYNIERSQLAVVHAVQKIELQEQQKEEREQLSEEYKNRYKSFEEWLDEKYGKDQKKGREWRYRRPRVNEITHEDNLYIKPKVADIRAFMAEADNQTGYVKYINKDTQDTAFIDKGKSIRVEQTDDATILASLQVAQQKWGRVKLSGTPEYITKCVEMAAKNGIKISNPELQEQYEVARIAAKAEYDKQPAGNPDKTPQTVANTDFMAVADTGKTRTHDAASTPTREEQAAEYTPPDDGVAAAQQKNITYYKVKYIFFDDGNIDVPAQKPQKINSTQQPENVICGRNEENTGDVIFTFVPKEDYLRIFKDIMIDAKNSEEPLQNTQKVYGVVIRDYGGDVMFIAAQKPEVFEIEIGEKLPNPDILRQEINFDDVKIYVPEERYNEKFKDKIAENVAIYENYYENYCGKLPDNYYFFVDIPDELMMERPQDATPEKPVTAPKKQTQRGDDGRE